MESLNSEAARSVSALSGSGTGAWYKPEAAAESKYRRHERLAASTAARRVATAGGNTNLLPK